MQEPTSVEELIKKHREIPAYSEIDNKIYIQDFHGLNTLNKKYNLLSHNYELHNYFRSYELIMESRSNPEKMNELLGSIDMSSMESVLKFQESLTSYDKYISLIKVHIKKENLPEEFKNKSIILVHAGKMHHICN